MASHETTIIAIVLGLLLVGYFLIYPKLAGSNVDKWLSYDFLFSVIALLLSGMFFWGKDVDFSIIFVNLNWFWFTLFCYVLFETPLAIWYAKKYKIWKPLSTGKNMADKKIKPIWYDLQYECDEDDDGTNPEVLYTSRSGLNSLIEKLQRIQSQDADGRIPLDISDVDRFYSSPFSHIEICEAPKEADEDEVFSMKPFIWGGLFVLVIVMLAGYGLFDLIKSIF